MNALQIATAIAACHRRRNDDAVAGFQIAHVLTDLSDHVDTFVPGTLRKRRARCVRCMTDGAASGIPAMRGLLL
ncbi:hypothetical protein [Paraburkholderia sp. BL18I3N2]|uniref:hypothetical protein n=1 Tax=Paraburkholderia sp. BL18I3N2 TaxID=1938799 RepID=UPI0015E78878